MLIALGRRGLLPCEPLGRNEQDSSALVVLKALGRWLETVSKLMLFAGGALAEEFENLEVEVPLQLELVAAKFATNAWPTLRCRLRDEEVCL